MCAPPKRGPDASGTATFIPIGDGETVTSEASHVDLQGTVGSGLGYYTQQDISYQPAAEWLTATDVRTGKKAWNTKDLTPPAVIAKLVTSDTATTARLMPFQGDKALLEWSSYGNSEAVITLVDVKTGRRLAEGPGVDTNGTVDDDGLAVSPDGKTAVVHYGKGAVAWNTETGEELWRQAADEVTITPDALPGNGVLYAYLDGAAAALGADDKKLLTSGIEEMPQFTTNGYASVRTPEGLFVFAAQSVCRAPARSLCRVRAEGSTPEGRRPRRRPSRRIRREGSSGAGDRWSAGGIPRPVRGSGRRRWRPPGCP
ncbi:PQQ-binding-like beta-propeller repeat protein [Streptomyces sp. SID6041]|nr:PQQ-binding-like beta-propeller repeat protein [Streptomyces sp. SID6041]